MSKKGLIARMIASILSVSMVFSFASCGKKTEAEIAAETATKEIRLNDYRGGYCRTEAIKNNIVGLMENMKENNTAIRSENPNSYWTRDGYQDFVTNFLNNEIFKETQWFNEEETTWEQIVSQMSKTESRFTSGNSQDGYSLKSGVSIIRNEKDDYTITGIETKETGDFGTTMSDYRVLYDCDKDWCKAYMTSTISGQQVDIPSFTYDMSEYGRIDDDTFVIQTDKERLLVKFKSVDSDTDIREREIEEFYYSRLVNDGARTTFKPFSPISIYDSVTKEYVQENDKYNEAMKLYPKLNENGDLSDRYGANDSVFLLQMSEITPDWVFEDKSLQQAITYKNGILIVTTYNKLSEKYERFIYALDGADESTIKELENMVSINNLVGIIQVTEEIADTEDASESIAETSDSVLDDTTSSMVVSGTVPPQETPAETETSTEISATTDESKVEE